MGRISTHEKGLSGVLFLLLAIDRSLDDPIAIGEKFKPILDYRCWQLINAADSLFYQNNQTFKVVLRKEKSQSPLPIANPKTVPLPCQQP